MADRRVYVFQHVACEDLGTFAEVLSRREFEARFVRFFDEDSVPPDWESAAALIVLGGPMSVNDEASLPYLRMEKSILARAVAKELPVLGICLGAQLLASAAGARVFPGPRPEIGWAPVTLSVEGRQDPVMREIAALPSAFHWHGETFDLPLGATRLAFSGLTMNQALRVGRRAYGLQFHLEVDGPMITRWVNEYPQDVESAGCGGATRIAAETELHVKALRKAASSFFNRFLDLVDGVPA